MVSKVVKYGFKSAFLRKLTEEHYAYQNSIEKETEKYNEKVDITLIDMGMAVCLSKEKKTAMLLQLWLLMRENAENDPILIGFWGKKYQTKFIKIHLWALSKDRNAASAVAFN